MTASPPSAPAAPVPATDFTFHLHARDGAARTGEIRMPRGVIRTPAFMPEGTAATVKGMYPEQVRALGADVVLGNTYHLMLRPGAERIAGEWTWLVTNSEGVNAFVSPYCPRHVFVHEGLLHALTPTEDELAFSIAHEHGVFN